LNKVVIFLFTNKGWHTAVTWTFFNDVFLGLQVSSTQKPMEEWSSSQIIKIS